MLSSRQDDDGGDDEVRELPSLYIYIDIFMDFLLKTSLHTAISYQVFLSKTN